MNSAGSRAEGITDLRTATTRTPADVPEELFRALETHFSLVTAIALENFRARFNRPFDIASENVSEGAFGPLPEREIQDT